MPEARRAPSEQELAQLRGLLLQEMERANFEQMVKTNLLQDTAKFTDATDYAQIIGATFNAAQKGDWLARMLAALVYERQGTSVGALASKLCIRYVGDDGLQSLISDIDGYFDWSEASRRMTVIGRHVCLIEFNTGPQGTGVLVGADLVLTAYHVVRPRIKDGKEAPDSHKKMKVTFDFCSSDSDGEWQPNRGHSKEVVKDWLVAFSPPHPSEIARQIPPDDGQIKEYDYALIRLAERVGEEVLPGTGAARGWAAMEALAAPLAILQRITIAQHPMGQPLRGSTGRISTIPPHRARIRYSASTQNVSSGSPCWNNEYQLVAMHNFGRGQAQTVKENQGVPIDCILEHVRAKRGKEAIVLPPQPAAGVPAKADATVPGVAGAVSRMWTVGANYPILSRSTLQQTLASIMADDGARLLLVSGERYSGRTFTTRIIQQFLRPFGHLALTVPGADLMDKHPEEVLAGLRSMLSLPEAKLPPGADLTTRSAQIGRHLLNGFFGDFRQKYPATPAPPAQPMQVWLLFDGLDQVRCPEDTHELISELVQRLDAAPSLRVALIGYERELPGEVEDMAAKERIGEITASDVVSFLRHASQEKGLLSTDAQLKSLAKRIMSKAPDNPQKRVREIARLVRGLAAKLGDA